MAKQTNWWVNRWRHAVDLFKKGFPYITIIVGAFMASLGMINVFSSDNANIIVGGLGKVILGSGLFTFMIKSFQYSNVFKEELTKIIFEPEYLENRKDLNVYWNKVSTILFEDKFKGISQKLLIDIRDKYLPTNSIMYYEDAEHTVEIILKDKKSGDATLKRRFKLKAIPEKSEERHVYNFGIAIPYKTKIEDLNYSTSVKVNGEVKIMAESTNREDFISKDGNLVKQYEVELNGHVDYEIERTETVDYNLYFDNIIYFQANKIHNKITVNLHYPKNLLTVELRKCGTLTNFVKDGEFANSARFVCNGIIYPEQGYYINIRPIR